jgi:hypothetical protein
MPGTDEEPTDEEPTDGEPGWPSSDAADTPAAGLNRLAVSGSTRASRVPEGPWTGARPPWSMSTAVVGSPSKRATRPGSLRR